MRTRRLAIGIGVLAVMVGGLLAPSVGAVSPYGAAAAAHASRPVVG